MRNLPYFLMAILGCVSMSLAQATTMPDQASQQMKVLVVPFGQLGATDHEWVGQALNENLVTQVAGDSAVQAINLSAPLNGQAEAVSAAKHVNAEVVIFGTYQFADAQLRVTGQVFDTVNGRTMGTLSATGALTDLFKIEDAISSQVAAAIPQPTTATNLPQVTYGPDQSTTPPNYTTADTTEGQPESQPAQTYVYGQASAQPTYVYAAPPSYVYSYPYPYYGYYGYPFYYGGIVVVSNGRYCAPYYGHGGYYHGGSWGYHGGSWGGHPGYGGAAIGVHSGFAGGGAHFAGGGGFMGGGGHFGGGGMGGGHR